MENNKIAKIVILSGEGEFGTFKEYKGKATHRAIKMALTKEMCHGDRWARAYVYCHTTDDGQNIYRNFKDISDKLWIPAEMIVE